jgi:ankyrin repeat protein
LNSAALHCRLDIFRLLLDHGADIKNAAPLHFVASSKSRDRDPIPVLQHFIDLGFDVNGVHRDPWVPKTPIGCAAKAKNIPAMRFLIKKGADPNDAMIWAETLNNRHMLQICQGIPNL